MCGDCADSIDFVRCNRNSQASAADQKSSIGFAVSDCVRNVYGYVGVGRCVSTGDDAEVDDLISRMSARLTG